MKKTLPTENFVCMMNACHNLKLTFLHSYYDSCDSTPEINIDDVLESSTNELPLSAFSFKSSKRRSGADRSNSNSRSASPFFARHSISQIPTSFEINANTRDKRVGRLVKAASDSNIQTYETETNSNRDHRSTVSQLTFEHRVVSSVVSPSHCPFTNTAPFIEPGSVRRQRHSIAGQMSYFKMLGFGLGGDYHKTKMMGGGSTSSLFSTAVISGSSSAPNLRDMIPSTASVSCEYYIL